MAFEGLVQWTQAVVAQSARVSAARERQSSLGMTSAPPQRRQARHAFHSECHFFAIAAHKLLEYREWVPTFGVCASVDFSEIAQFSAQDIRDLRNVREHVLAYFRGAGNAHDRVDRGDTGVSRRRELGCRNYDRRPIGLGCIWGRRHTAIAATAR